nr:hypothetical protein [Tanacetum cinerariifolium]GFA53994.1 hypothetical protein [Tanacetum cinerariifolium]
AAYDESYGPLQHLEVSLIQSSSNKPFQASHNPPCLEHLVNGLDHGHCSVLITFSPDYLWPILHPNPFQTIIKSIANIIELYASRRFRSDQYVSSLILLGVPFHNLEIGGGNDPPLGVYIESRFSVNGEPVELLTFLPPVRNYPKGVLVIVYRLLYPHSTRHQVFNPLDMPIICSLRLCHKCCIFSAGGTSPKILKVVVYEVCKWNDTATSVIRFPPNDIQALSGCYMTPSSIHRKLARSCSNHNPELEVSSTERTSSNGVLADSGSFPSLYLLDPRSDPAEGPSP